MTPHRLHPTGRLARRLWPALAVAALLVGAEDTRAQQAVPLPVVRAVAVAPENVWSDEQFEQWALSWAFSASGNAASPRRGMDTLLALQVEEIDRVCQLSDEQKKKLRLMGGGDVKRMFDILDRAKIEFKQVNNDGNRLGEILPRLQPLQTAAQRGVFRGDSLFAKSLRHTLTEEQMAKYGASEKERLAFLHRARIELAVHTLEQQMPLREEQRRGLIDVWTKEIKPFHTPDQSSMQYMVLGEACLVPEGKIKPLFTDTEWKNYNRFVGRYRGNRAPRVADDEEEVLPVPAQRK